MIKMKYILKFVITTICILFFSGCYFDEINQPNNAQLNENIQIQIKIIDNLVPEANAHKGLVYMLVPTDWEFLSGNYSFSEGIGTMALSEVWADSAENCYPAQLIHNNMHWIALISDIGYSYNDPIEITVDLEFQTGNQSGCFPIGYITSKATPNLICSGVQSWAPFSYPHPIQIATTDDCNMIVASPEEDWSELFHRFDGWTGADGIYSIPFNGNEQNNQQNNKTLFVFSDTFIGPVDSITGQRLSPTFMVNNTYAILDGNNPITDRIEFYYRTDSNGEPISIIAPNTENSQDDDWYWLMDGIAINNRFYLFALRMEHENNGQAGFNFAVAGVSLISFELTDDNEISNVEEIDTPLFFEHPDGWSVVYGQAILSKTIDSGSPNPDGYIYFYGAKDGNGIKEMTVGRVLEGFIDDFSNWEFWDGNQWSSNIEDSYTITQNISQEFSVTQLSEELYIAIFQLNGLGNEVAYRLSNNIQGPFGFFNPVWSVPEVELDPDYFPYNAKAHPHLSDNDELLISYNLNSFDFWDHFSDGGLYRPRFISIPISGLQPSLSTIDQSLNLPVKISILKAFPNPFNSNINFELYVEEQGLLDISVYDLNGRSIITFHKGMVNSGSHHFVLNFDDVIQSGSSSGVYFINAKMANFSSIRKILYLK